MKYPSPSIPGRFMILGPVQSSPSLERYLLRQAPSVKGLEKLKYIISAFKIQGLPYLSSTPITISFC
jgi:hypothetical protein